MKCNTEQLYLKKNGKSPNINLMFVHVFIGQKIFFCIIAKPKINNLFFREIRQYIINFPLLSIDLEKIFYSWAFFLTYEKGMLKNIYTLNMKPLPPSPSKKKVKGKILKPNGNKWCLQQKIYFVFKFQLPQEYIQPNHKTLKNIHFIQVLIRIYL